MLVLIVKLIAENENYYAETQYALFPLNQKALNSILYFRQTALRLAGTDEGFIAMEYKPPVDPVCVSELSLGAIIDASRISDVACYNMPENRLWSLKPIGSEHKIGDTRVKYWRDGDITINLIENDQLLRSEMFCPHHELAHGKELV